MHCPPVANMSLLIVGLGVIFACAGELEASACVCACAHAFPVFRDSLYIIIIIIIIVTVPRDAFSPKLIIMSAFSLETMCKSRGL